MDCDQVDALSLWNTALLDLDRWMVSVQTDPDIREIIIHNLSNWPTGLHPHNPLDRKTFLAFDQQCDIGWNVMIEGWITFEWAATQEEYYKFLGSWRTGRRWVIALIKKLWQIAWDLWQHHNNVLHEQENDVAQKESEQLNRRIRTLFFRSLSILRRTPDGYLLKTSLSALVDKPLIYRQEWERKVKLALTFHKTKNRGNRRSIRGMRRLMRTWVRRNR
jgi:hypothetical protein